MKVVQLTLKFLVLLATVVLAGPALAAPGVTLTTTATSVQVGEEFTVAVELSGLDQIEGVDLQLSYDQQKLDGINLQLIYNSSVPNGSKTEINGGFATVLTVFGKVISLNSMDNRIAVLGFRALSAGNFTIKVDKLDVAVPVPGDEGISQLVSLGSAELQMVVQQASAADSSNNDNSNQPGTGNESGSNQGNSAVAPGTGNQPAAGGSNSHPPGRSPVDVAPGHWARSAIQQLVDGGYASGYEDGSFKPEQEITRAEFLALVTRILGLEGASAAEDVNNAFSDGAAIPAWARGVVASAYTRGLVQGDEQGRFRPDAPISRAEIAAIVIRALGEEEQSKAGSSGQQAFTDSPQASWAAGYLGRGKQLGLMTGYEDGSFRPNNRSTRAEAAALVSRMLGRLQPGTGS